jgi:hypothetical protein
MAHLDCYLDQVRRQLGGLAKAEVEEILAELRSHVLDKVEGAPTPQRVEAAIEALGGPREVARLNLTERVAATLETDRSALRVFSAVGRLARLSLYGFFAFLVSLFGYAASAGFLLTAIVKPFMPQHAGLWRIPTPDGSYDYSIGTTDAPQGYELLGWWIIPIGLAVGLILGWLTWRFGLFSVRRMRRTVQRGRA